MLSWPVKDPNDVLDYTLDWSLRLPQGDGISASLWLTNDAVSPPSLVVDSDSFDANTATAWLSGGTAGTTYIVTNRVTTSEGRVMDQSVKLKVKEK